MLLFALKYEREGRPQTSSLIQHCQDFGMTSGQLGVVKTLLLHAGADRCASLPTMCLMLELMRHRLRSQPRV